MLDGLIFKLMKRKDRDKFLKALEEKLPTDEFLDYIRDFAYNPRSDTELMNEFKKWLKNKKKY